MKHDVAVKWAEALEGGEFAQGQGWLCRGGRHCCLGVLCELLGVPKRSAMGGTDLVAFADVTRSLPAEAMAAAGVKTTLGALPEGPAAAVWQSLAQMNDNAVPFADIARTIRAHWEAL